MNKKILKVIFFLVFLIIIWGMDLFSLKKTLKSQKNDKNIKEEFFEHDNQKHDEKIVIKDGVTYVDGILLVNKVYSLPEKFGTGVDEQAIINLQLLQASAKKEGYIIDLISGYRTYDYQKKLYESYVQKHGQEVADTFSAKPGHSEHQTGLAFDVGRIDDNYGDTKEGIWLSNNAHLYGFIIRYPKDKELITGYKYEPWHIRYLGKEIATKVFESGLCLEEYLKV